MRELPGEATANCPDAGALAAYYDRAIPLADAKHLEEHFADCARCQLQLASIARADSETIEAPRRSPIAWLRGWRIAIPAFAAAAAILIAIRLTRNTEGHFERAQIVAMSKPQAAANAPDIQSLAALQPAPKMEALASPVVGDLALNEMKRAPAIEEHRAALADRPQPLAKEKSLDTFARLAKSAVEPPGQERSKREEAVTESEPKIAAGAEDQASGVSAPSAPAAGALAMRADTAAKAPAEAATGNSFAAASSAAGAASSGGSAGAGAFAGNGTAASGVVSPGRPADAGFSVVVSVDESAWEVGPKGKIAHRVDAGDYVPQKSGVTVDLLAAVAVSKDICWIGGRDGTILRTTDGGNNWRKIASPTSEDIASFDRVVINEAGGIGITADHAGITTASGKKFATTDGGASWRPQ